MSRTTQSRKRLGRPSSYKHEFADQLVEHMRTGMSFESFAGLIGRAVSTLYEWEKTHPDFSEAKKKAEAACLLFWEKMGLFGVVGKIPDFNTAVWIFNMKARFRKFGWSDLPADDSHEKKDWERALEKAFSNLDEGSS